nr:hypothetical protein [Gluconobacter oxydans]
MFKKTEYFLDKKFYKDVFIIDDLENDISFNNNAILINIRAGEICNGIWAYPLIPFSFYKHIIDTTNYSPIFMGQIDDSLYIKDLKNNFPNATFLKSGGGKKDMARLRAAPRVCMTVSTFSWVNSYLSEAKEVHYPILGILHPNIMNGYNRCDINLLPINDSRYIYYLFPIIRGCKEDKYINEIEKIQPICKKIPTSMSVFLQKNKSLLKIDDSKEVDEVDEEFYLKNYIEASWEISQGLYKNSREHYNLIGKYRKYEPYEKLRISFYEENFKKIQDFLKVSQSSICDHSIGRNVEDDARNAIFGVNGSNYSFHTDFEEKTVVDDRIC